MDEIPRMEPPHRDDDPPFIRRLKEILYHWVQEEWLLLQTLKLELDQQLMQNNKHAATNARLALEQAQLTPENLAARLGNMSLATLRRELKLYKAPTPGTLIRTARIRYGCHLLKHTRLTVRKIAVRSGYEDERHFTSIFKTECGIPPARFRRKHIYAMQDAWLEEVKKNPPQDLVEYLEQVLGKKKRDQ